MIAMSGYRRGCRGGAQPLVRVVGWHPDVGDHDVGSAVRDEGQECVGVFDGRDDLVTGAFEEADETLTQERDVLGETTLRLRRPDIPSSPPSDRPRGW